MFNQTIFKRINKKLSNFHIDKHQNLKQAKWCLYKVGRNLLRSYIFSKLEMVNDSNIKYFRSKLCKWIILVLQQLRHKANCFWNLLKVFVKNISAW